MAVLQGGFYDGKLFTRFYKESSEPQVGCVQRERNLKAIDG